MSRRDQTAPAERMRGRRRPGPAGPGHYSNLLDDPMLRRAVQLGRLNPGAGLASDDQAGLRTGRPTAEAAGGAEPLPARDSRSGQDCGRALVIDDEPGIRRFARLLLDEAGFEVELSGDGEAGLAFVRAESPLDLVLLDVTMPGLTGIEVLTELRLLAPRLPVVLMSGYHEGELGSLLEADPFTRFLQKPFSAESLAEVVRTLLGTSGESGR